MTTLADVVDAREAAVAADRALRVTCLAALKAGEPLSQVAIAADVSRQTLYRWRDNEAAVAATLDALRKG